jgi:protein-S-isoprenylcysteine O-methyltransferase Ste14
VHHPVKSVWRIPPLYFLFCLGIVVAGFMLFPSLNRILFPARCAGAILVIAGILILAWSLRLFRKYGTPERLDLPTVYFVSEGPYKFSRNPQYLSGLLILVGASLALGNILSFIAPIVFYFCMRVLIIPYEEQEMKDLFLESYIDYTKKVRRWI